MKDMRGETLKRGKKEQKERRRKWEEMGKNKEKNSNE